MRGWSVAAMLALSLSVSSTAGGQRANSLEVGLLTEFEEAALLVGFRTTKIAPGGVGVDFSISIPPQTLGDGLFAITHLDAGTAITVGSASWVLPRFGVSAVVAAGEGFGGAAAGFNLGIGLLGRIGDKGGVRLDVTHMRFLEDGGTFGISVLSVGYAWVK